MTESTNDCQIMKLIEIFLSECCVKDDSAAEAHAIIITSAR